MAAKIRNALVLYRRLRASAARGVPVHQTICTTRSIAAMTSCWSTPHIYGVAAAHAPVWHLRRVAGGEIAPRTWRASSGLDSACRAGE